MMPVTKEPHRSSDAPCATVTLLDAVIDAVRYAHRHPTFFNAHCTAHVTLAVAL